MVDNSLDTDKGYLTIVVKDAENGFDLCEMGFLKKPGELLFHVDYENGSIFIANGDNKDIIGIYETAPRDPYRVKVFDYPSNHLIGLVGNGLIRFSNSSDANRDINRISIESKCLADYSESGSIRLHGHPLNHLGLINGSLIGGAAAFVAVFFNYRINSIFRDFFTMDKDTFMESYDSVLNPF